MRSCMRNKRIIITGGAGFIGINASERFMNEGYDVIIFDNLSREGTEKNLKWLTDKWSCSPISNNLSFSTRTLSLIFMFGNIDKLGM